MAVSGPLRFGESVPQAFDAKLTLGVTPGL